MVSMMRYSPAVLLPFLVGLMVLCGPISAFFPMFGSVGNTRNTAIPFRANEGRPSKRHFLTGSDRTIAGTSTGRQQRTMLFDGRGVATNYTWTEDPVEIEVSITVPKGTRANQLNYKAKPKSVHLTLGDTVLLDGSRQMRGRVSMDGSFWDIRDPDRYELERNADMGDCRIVTVTIEKNLRQPKDVFDPFWKGVYPDDKEEVLERKYEEMKELNIREYSASLGVDIDNINMSMVDKTLFSSGLNMTKRQMDDLVKKGFVKEVTQQTDGTEYVSDDEGNPVPYSRFGDAASPDEVRENDAMTKKRGDHATKTKLPFIDTSSPWNQAVSIEDTEVIDAIRNATKADATASNTTASNGRDQAVGAAFVSNSDAPSVDSADRSAPVGTPRSGDPIDNLKVARLKDILRREGLKVTGNKKELQDRLKEHVRSMIQKPT